MLQRNVYGWFTRIERGTYILSEGGRDALTRFAAAIAILPAVPVSVELCPVAA